MHKALLIAFLIPLAFSGPSAQAKTTADPNAPGVQRPVTTHDSVDTRLAKKINYDSGYKRLHEVADDVAKLSGVTIRCGKNKEDWQVRDLPVIVCANDISLGKLLQAIADCTHLDFTSETIKTDVGEPEKVYRVWFREESQSELDGYREEQRQACVAEQSCGWDALVASVDLPDSAISKYISSNQDNVDAIHARQALGRILAELGPGTKAKVIDGQRLDLTLSSYDRPDLYRSLYALAQKESYHFEANYALQNPSSTFKLEPPTEEQIDASSLTIMSHTDPATGQFFVGISLYPVRNGDNSDTLWSCPLSSATEKLRDGFRDAKFSGPEKTTRRYPQLPDHISKDLAPISSKPDEAVKSPILSRKVKLGLPNDRDVTYSEVLAALAKASGVTIISEDYLSQLHRQYAAQLMGSNSNEQIKATISPLGSERSDEMTVGQILAKLARPQQYHTITNWFIDDKNGIVVGRSDDWLRNHKNLIPESLLAYLRDKANSEGVELDDLCKLTSYEHRGDWIDKSKDLYFLSRGFDLFWRFYGRLTPQDKAQARTDAGLPLAKYDTIWIADFVKTECESGVTMYGGDLKAARRAKKEADRRAALFTNPDVIRSITLRITVRPSTSSTTYKEGSIASYTTAILKGVDRHTYYPTIQGMSQDGQPFSIDFEPLAPAFPIYSPKREAELRKDRAETAKP